MEKYECQYCGKSISEDKGITCVDGSWVCDNDQCRTLDEDSQSHIKVSYRTKLVGALVDAIRIELEPIANGELETANYWINKNYNVFAFHEDNGDGDEWISVKLEQYDDNEECINCELHYSDTDDMSLAGLETAIKTIVEWY